MSTSALDLSEPTSCEGLIIIKNANRTIFGHQASLNPFSANALHYGETR